MEILESGVGELFHIPDPDKHRAYMLEHRKRGLVEKVMTEQEAVSKFVSDGDYLCYDCTMLMRGPSSLVREVIRQQKKDLGVGGRFTYVIVNLLVAAGCVNRIDIGYIGVGQALKRAFDEGIKVSEWSNSAITMRLLAGSLGIPFIPIRFLGGTDAFHHSAAKLAKDPWGNKEVVLVPALNPDVGLIHVHQCDVYGNARIFGPSVSPLEIATASKKVIISTEEIIDTEYIRRDPGRTSIPYYLVDAVVEAPFGAHPGEVAGVYASDSEAIFEIFRAGGDVSGAKMKEYLEKAVYSLKNHQEYLNQRVGLDRLLALKKKATIKQGYS
jgi:acyl CoA:acetate/3-ketoacid CoA transferase alpha subunit